MKRQNNGVNRLEMNDEWIRNEKNMENEQIFK